jgi:hypothetical protein
VRNISKNEKRLRGENLKFNSSYGEGAEETVGEGEQRKSEPLAFKPRTDHLLRV